VGYKTFINPRIDSAVAAAKANDFVMVGNQADDQSVVDVNATKY
jgi:hypothetical protein